MNVLRTVLFDNLGLKLVALLLAVLVYLNVYTDRPATMIVSFPIQITDLADSLALSGPVPAAVQAQLRGTAKQLIRLRVSEPPLKVSLGGVGAGRFERALGIEDLPLPQGVDLQLDRMVSPRTLELEVDRKISRELPVAITLQGQPAAVWNGKVELRPPRVIVTGPAAAVAALDSVRLPSLSLDGRRDTLTLALAPQALPDWCVIQPDHVEVWVPLEPGITRRLTLAVESPPRGASIQIDPPRVSAIVTAPRRLISEALAGARATWDTSGALPAGGSRRAAVRPVAPLPEGIVVRYTPDSVTVSRQSR